MGTRTVRLDDKTEQTLDRVRAMTGLSISEVLKHGICAYETQVLEQARCKPYEVFRQLDLGAGGYAVAPARDAKLAISEVIRRKRPR